MRTLLLLFFFLSCFTGPPAFVWLTYKAWGAPHIVYSYRFHDNGRRYDPLAKRHYISCTYWGARGTITVPAERSHCPWIRFFTHGRRAL